MGRLPASSPPHVWRDLELVNSNGKQLKFSLQNIPEDRYDEVLEHMCTSFASEEALLSSINILEDAESLAVLRSLWAKALSQGISVAAFEKAENDEKPQLAGLNILAIVDDEVNEKFTSLDISNIKAKNFFEFIWTFSAEGDPRKLFNADKYLAAYGLSVLPSYRGLGLGKRLLELRDDIGHLHNICVTETIFTSAVSQKIAASVGFKVYIDRAYDDIVDKEGKKIFPSLTGKRIKIMMKQFV